MSAFPPPPKRTAVLVQNLICRPELAHYHRRLWHSLSPRWPDLRPTP